MPAPTTSTRCVYCKINWPHARHVSLLEANQLGVCIIDLSGAGTRDAVSKAAVTNVTSDTAPSAPKE